MTKRKIIENLTDAKRRYKLLSNFSAKEENNDAVKKLYNALRESVIQSLNFAIEDIKKSK